MNMRKRRAFAAIILVLGLTSATGTPVGGGEIPTQDKSLWDGVYTAEQSVRGEAVYQKDCAYCHSDDLRGGAFAPALIEGAFTSRWEDSTVGELFASIKATMPADRTDRLPDADYAAIVAYLLKMNKFPAGEQELSTTPAELDRLTFKRP